MTKKLILHIGTQKTGTTSIQNFLGANAALLAEQGIGYPLDLGGFRTVAKERNAHVLDRAAVVRARAKSEKEEDERLIPGHMQRLRAHIAAHDTLLLSDERIWSDGATYKKYWKSLRAITDELGFDEVRIVLYRRRQDRYYESRWNQMVKATTTRTQSAPDMLEALPRYARANFYGEYLKKAEKYFGRDNITVRIFERPKLVNGDAVDDFVAAAGIEIDERYVRPTDANPSLTCNLVQIKQWVNQSPAYRELGDNFLRAAAVQATINSTERRQESVFTAQERAEFLAQFEEGNDYIAQEYFGIPGADLFDTTKADPPAWEADPLSLERDMVLFFTEALSQERAERKRIEDELRKYKKAHKQLKAKLDKTSNSSSGSSGGGLKGLFKRKS